MRLLSSIVLACLLVFPVSALAEELAIPGTGDGVAVLESSSAAFEQKTGVSVRVPKSIGSGGGVKAVGNGMAELARVARGIKDKEQHFGLSYQALFNVPTVFLVNKEMSVENLTAQQVLDIFSGKISNWKDVGGEDRGIFVVRREKGDSSLDNLTKTFPGFSDEMITQKAYTVPKTPNMVAQVQNRKYCIAFGPFDVALANDLKVLKVDGKVPGEADYPYFGTIGLVYKKESLMGVAKQFVEFATSEKAHAAIRKTGGLPL